MNDKNMYDYSLKQVSKVYTSGGGDVCALSDVSIEISHGELVVLAGPSGSGKTTLANILGCLDTPSTGQYFFNNLDVSNRDAKSRTLFRRDHIGFVFQSHNLIPVLTAAENVALSCELQGITRAESLKRAKHLLSRLRLDKEMNRYPKQLSGGQQQRVAFARALVKRPFLLLADEPTAHLDSDNASLLITLLRDTVIASNITCVICTHDERMIQVAERVITLRDGKVDSDRTA